MSDMQQYRLKQDAVEWRDTGDEIVALDVGTATYLSVNPSGAVLWEAVTAGATREQLVERLVERFDIDREHAGADVDAFLVELGERGLLEG
jgi:hypothetical protein